MAEGSSVPKFGNWETGDNVPYTVSFDKARKTRSKTKSNSIQSQRHSESDPILSSSEPTDHDAIALRFRAMQGKGGDAKLPESPITVAPPSECPLNRLSPGDKNRRGIRRNGTSDFSIDSKLGSKGNGVSPVFSLERKGSSGGGVPMTPGRSRHRSASRAAPDDSHQVDESAAIPKFGEWDENNPESGDGYTVIFNKVKEERHGGGGGGGGGSTKPSNLSNQNSKSNSQKHYTNQNSKAVSCFCWG